MKKDSRPVSYQQTLGTKTEKIQMRAKSNNDTTRSILNGGGDPNLSPDADKPLR